MDNIVVGRETVERQGVKESLLRYVGKSVDGFSDKTEAETTSLQVTNAANGINVESGNFTTNGLVSIDKIGATNQFAVTGQEDKVTGMQTAIADGSTLSTRIFGNRSVDLNNAATKNSARFLGKVNAQGNYDITGLGLTAAENGTANKFETTKLNNVQYGRVTSTIDKLEDSKLKAGTKYYQSVLVDTRNPVKAGNDTVDTYFYRGIGETTVAQMDALQAKGGKVEYAGHALMYGIDNAYHGNLGDPDSNSFGGTDKPVAGKGNFVQATVDMGNRTVEGNIFNVWQVTPAQGDDVFKQDKLVNFNGQIFGNTAKGESQLAYGDKDKGAFKGSFYGNQAQEFGGSVNSVDKGYGNAAWGGVFGANQVVPPTITPEDGNANQTE